MSLTWPKTIVFGIAEQDSKMGEKRSSRTPKSSRVFGHPAKQVPTKLRVGLYARVSTHDQQTIPLQTRAMRDYAARWGWTVAVQIKEAGFGRSEAL